MANEITVISQMTVAKGNLNHQPPARRFTADMAGDRARINQQTIGTTYEAIDFGDISTAGLVWFTNLDPDNYVEIGKQIAGPAFDPFLKMLPGESAGPFRLSSQSIYGRANTAAVDVEIMQAEA